LKNSYPCQHHPGLTLADQDDFLNSLPTAIKMLDDLNFPRKTQRELMWFSTFMFVLVALLVRFAINLQTCLIMKYFHIRFEYRVFGNILEKGGRGNWSDWKVILVFGLGPLVAFGLGLLVIRALQRSNYLAWKSRLFLTWLAFIMVLFLPMSMLAGVFFYDDFGYAFANFFISKLIRAGLSLFILALTVFFRPLWMELFLRTAYSHRIVDQQAHFIGLIFILPWMIGTLIIFPFTFIEHYWAWLMLLISMGLVVIPIFGNREFNFKIRLTKTDKRVVFKNKLSLFGYIIAIILLFLLSFIRIPM